MYRLTIAHYDCMGSDDLWTAKGMKRYWERLLDDCLDVNPDVVEGWFSYIGVQRIAETIDWDFIATKYNESRCIIYNNE
jgi:hypothetical protein